MPKLTIRFVGLTLFGTAPDRVHALLPRVRGSGTHGRGHPRHSARILVDSAYLDPGATKKDDYWTHIPISDLTLHLGKGLPSALPGTVAKFGESVSQEALAGDPDLVTSRIILKGGTFADSGKRECWSWRSPEPRLLTNAVTWTLDELSDDPGDWSDEENTPEALAFLREFSAIDQLIELEVWNVPLNEFPPEGDEPTVDDGMAAPHFDAYHRLLSPQPSSSVPVHRRGACLGMVAMDSNSPPLGGSAFTCMVASAPAS